MDNGSIDIGVDTVYNNSYEQELVMYDSLHFDF